jgi:hypothetical protein
MKRNRNGSTRRRKTVRVWSQQEARTALPYIRSVVSSLREHYVEARRQRRTARLLAGRPGRPDRATLIAQDDALREAERAERRFHEAEEELAAIDVYPLDPVRGQALIPFVYDDQLAWYVFDLFEPEPLRSWRFHSDPLDSRRPVAEMAQGSQDGTWTA